MNEGLVVIIRGVISFCSLLIYTRILGKQQVSQLTFFDYILGITIGSTASSLTTDLGSRAWPHWIGLTIWFMVVYLLQIITTKFRMFSKFIDGEAVIVIMNGQLLDNAIKKLRLRIADIMGMLREQGVFDISQVEFAILETSGKMSVLKKSQFQPATPSDFNLSTSYMGLSTELIYDGEVLEKSLKKVNLNRKWLDDQLEKQGILTPSEVFLATLNTAGELYVSRYQSNIKKMTDIVDDPGPN